ncbi:MAG: hypothetical protein CR991_11865, partial [Proteobacteria bacterium]
LGMFRASRCSILDVGCHGTFDLVVVEVRRLFYLAPICLASYTGLIMIFFRSALPSWLFAFIAPLFVAVLYEHHLYGLTNLIYLLAAYSVFRAILIYQGQKWPGARFNLITKILLKNYKRILLFLILLVSVTIFFPALIDRIYTEIVNCEKTYQQYCSERRMERASHLYQVLYLLPVMVLSFIGLYRDERRFKTRLFIDPLVK